MTMPRIILCACRKRPTSTTRPKGARKACASSWTKRATSRAWAPTTTPARSEFAMAQPSDLIGLHARLQPGRLAARDLTSGEAWTYAALDDLVARLASELVARGAVQGDRIAVLARNSVLQVALHFACARAGFIYAPMNWRLGAAEIAVLLELAEPKLLFADERSADLLGQAPYVLLADVAKGAAGRPPYDGPLLGPTLPSLLLFTSGTSGKPKGGILTERNLHETAVNFGMLTRIGN